MYCTYLHVTVSTVCHTLSSLSITRSQLMSQNFDRNPRMAWLSERHYYTDTLIDRASENRQQTGIQCHQTRSIRVKRHTAMLFISEFTRVT